MRMNEALGVPEGITRVSGRIYRELIDKLDSLEIKEEAVVIGEWDIKFSDLDVRDIPIILRINIHPFVFSPVLTGASYGNKSTWSEVGGKLFLKHNVPSSFIIIDVTANHIDSDEIKKCIKSQLKPAVIAHEIHHLYEASKSKRRPLKDITNYKSYQVSNFPQIINEFLHLLYYVTTIENFVRPSEMLFNMEEEGVTRAEFANWIKETDMMKRIEKARTFSVNKFFEEVVEDEGVKRILRDSKQQGFESTGDDKKDIMKIIYINISNIGSQVGGDLLNSYFQQINTGKKRIFLNFLGIESSELKKAKEICDREFNGIIKFYQKWEGREEKYFEFLQKRINFAGEKMKKKLSKLWAHLNESKSILNWELWTKMVNGDKPLVTKIDFNQIKSNFNKGLK